MLFALGDGCSPPPNVVGVQDFGRVTGRVLDAMTNRPIPNALVSVGSLYTTGPTPPAGFILRAVAGDQTVTARAAGYSTATADTTIPKDVTVSIGYIRLVPLDRSAGPAHAPPPATPTPRPSAGTRERRAHARLPQRQARSRRAPRPSASPTVTP